MSLAPDVVNPTLSFLAALLGLALICGPWLWRRFTRRAVLVQLYVVMRPDQRWVWRISDADGVYAATSDTPHRTAAAARRHARRTVGLLASAIVRRAIVLAPADDVVATPRVPWGRR